MVVLLFQLHVILIPNVCILCIAYTFMYVHALLQKYRIGTFALKQKILQSIFSNKCAINNGTVKVDV